MTDKERLEEIKRDKALINDDAVIKDIHYEWLIEEAERVQGLERVNKQLKGNLSVYKGYYKNMIKINEGIVEQNKLYREAREIMDQVYKDNYVRNAYGYEDGYLDGLDTAMDIIDKALEGEE